MIIKDITTAILVPIYMVIALLAYFAMLLDNMPLLLQLVGTATVVAFAHHILFSIYDSINKKLFK